MESRGERKRRGSGLNIKGKVMNDEDWRRKEE